MAIDREVEFCKTLPPEVRLWAWKICRAARPEELASEPEQSLWENREVLHRVLTDDDAAIVLAKIGAKISIQQLASWLDNIFSVIALIVPRESISPAVATRELKQIRNSLDRLAETLASKRVLVGVGLSVNYLQGRLSDPHPSNYAARNRSGLRAACWPMTNDQVTLIDLLEALSDDIYEELKFLPRRISAMGGREDQWIRNQIKWVKKISKNHDIHISAKDLAHLLTAASGQNIDAERIKKTNV